MTTDTTAALIAEIEARVEAASIGPWKWYPRGDMPTVSNDGGESWLAMTSSHPGAPSRNVNAEFIAHAREDIPLLLAEVRRLQAALESVGVEATTPHEAWVEGYRHGYIIGCEEGATGIVVEYVAPNPYPAPVTSVEGQTK